MSKRSLVDSGAAGCLGKRSTQHRCNNGEVAARAGLARTWLLPAAVFALLVAAGEPERARQLHGSPAQRFARLPEVRTGLDHERKISKKASGAGQTPRAPLPETASFFEAPQGIANALSSG